VRANPRKSCRNRTCPATLTSAGRASAFSSRASPTALPLRVDRRLRSRQRLHGSHGSCSPPLTEVGCSPNWFTKRA
jgi:hypothetical protein